MNSVCDIAHCWHRKDASIKCCQCSTSKPSGMIVMVSNQTGIEFAILAMQFPGRVGHMFSPGGERGPWPQFPHALDNDAWPAHKNKRPRDEAGHRKMLNWSLLSGVKPLFALVPDVLGDRDATLREWERWSPWMKSLGFRLGFAAQDGMTFGDVPDSECVVFLGGSTGWKDRAIAPWCAAFPGRVHVGRVNGADRLLACHQAGAMSVDGTGWFHQSNNSTGGQRSVLRKYLRETSNGQTLSASA